MCRNPFSKPSKLVHFTLRITLTLLASTAPFASAEEKEKPDSAATKPLSGESYLLQHETRLLDFADPGSFSALGKGFFQNTNVPFENKRLVWACEPRSEALLRVLSPGDKTLRVKMLSNFLPTAGPQKVKLLWEGVPLGEIEFPLEKKYGVQEVEFPIPTAIQKSGMNSLQFLSRYVLSQADTGDGKEKRPAAFGLISLEMISDDSPDDAAPCPDVAINGEEILQCAGTRLLFPLDVAGADDLSISMDGVQGEGKISVAWDTPDGGVQYEVLHIKKGIEKKTVEVSEFAEATPKPAFVELILDAPENAGGGACTWKNVALHVAPGSAKATALPLTKGVDPKVAINPAEIQNVVLVILDALRADALHCYGNPYETTPFIDSLAKGGYLFERHYSAGSFTFASTASLLTSLYPFQHRVNFWKDRLSDPSMLLQSVLGNGGIYTACVSQNPFLSEKNVLASGFNTFLPLFWTPKTDSNATVSATLDLSATLQDKPFFLYAHFLPPHSPFTMAGPYLKSFSYEPVDKLPLESNEIKKINQGLLPHTKLGVEQLRLRYFECLRFGDDLVKSLVEGLRSQGYGKETLLILTSDHGEEFMEHGWMGHGTFPHDTMQHIPLIVTTVNEGGLNGEASVRMSEIHRSVDLFPTICEVLEVDAKNPVMGRSLLHKDTEPTPPNTVQAYGTGNNEYVVEAYRFGHYKLLVSKVHAWRALYNTTQDPGEQANLAEVQPVLCDYFQAAAEAWKRERLEERGALESVQNEKIDNEEALKGLGYL